MFKTGVLNKRLLAENRKIAKTHQTYREDLS
jgi:hypothetical protein